MAEDDLPTTSLAELDDFAAAVLGVCLLVVLLIVVAGLVWWLGVAR